MLGVIGGTGLYALGGFEQTESRTIETPYGAPSAPIRIGRLHGQPLAFLARHGEQHQWLPHRVNYRANLWALREAGVTRIVAINAVGGIGADCAPQRLVIPDQIIDYSHGRISSFSDHENRPPVHIDFTEPYSSELRAQIMQRASAAGVDIKVGGTYGCTQGPRLETRAEITRMTRDGNDIVGMTGMPEAALARELAIPYACIAVVANWAAGCGDSAEITMDEINAHLAVAYSQVHELISNLG